MQSYMRDLEPVSLRAEPMPCQSETKTTTPRIGSSKGPVLRGNVIAESEQDLAKLLSHYQQGYYRPNEASVSVLCEPMNYSSNLQTHTENLSAGFKDLMRDDEKKRGSMMQLEHVAKASLLMRHIPLQQQQQSHQAKEVSSLMYGNNYSGAQREFSMAQHPFQSEQQQTALNSTHWPLSFGSLLTSERQPCQNYLAKDARAAQSVFQDHSQCLGSFCDPTPPPLVYQDLTMKTDSLFSYGIDNKSDQQQLMNHGFDLVLPEPDSSRQYHYQNQDCHLQSLDPYTSNSIYGQRFDSMFGFYHSSAGVPTTQNQTVVIPPRPVAPPAGYLYSNNPYHYMIPTPVFKKNKSLGEEQQTPSSSSSLRKGKFISKPVAAEKRMETVSPGNSARSSQDKVSLMSCPGMEENGFDFMDQLLAPGAITPASNSRKQDTKKKKSNCGRKPGSKAQQKSDEQKKNVGDATNKSSGCQWLWEELAKLPVDSHRTDECLIWNNNISERSDSYLLVSEDSMQGMLPHQDNMLEQLQQDIEVTDCLEKAGFTSVEDEDGLNGDGDDDGDGDLTKDYDKHPCTYQSSSLTKEDVLELAYCLLGKSTASVEELQAVCKLWVTSVPDHASGQGAQQQKQQHYEHDQQPSLENWLGMKHARLFSKEARGRRSIEISLKKDKRFIRERNGLWSCIGSQYQKDVVAGKNLRRKTKDKAAKNEEQKHPQSNCYQHREQEEIKQKQKSSQKRKKNNVESENYNLLDDEDYYWFVSPFDQTISRKVQKNEEDWSI